MADDDDKTPRKRTAAKKAPSRKVAAKKTSAAKRPHKAVTPNARDRAKAAGQIADVVPIKGGTTSRRGRQNASKPGKGANSPTSPRALALHERRVMALNLRRLGSQWEEVAATIRDTRPDLASASYTAADAHHDHKALLDSVTIEAVQGIREEDLATLMALQRRHFAKAVNDGDVKSTLVMLKILDSRAKYLGLYAPTRHELIGTNGGPIDLSAQATEREVYDAAWNTLEGVLPHITRPALPGTTQPPEPPP